MNMGEDYAEEGLTFIRDSDLALKIILRFIKSREMEISEKNIMRQLRQETDTSKTCQNESGIIYESTP